MLVTDKGGREPTPTPDDDSVRREVLSLLARLGPLLLAASQAIDSPAPARARIMLARAARLLAPYL